MKTFTAKFTHTEKQTRYIPNCTIYKGKVVRVGKKGIGKSHTEYWTNGIDDAGEETVYEEYVDEYRAIFNSSLFEKNGLTRGEVERLVEEDQGNAFSDERILKCLFTLGENEGGYYVTNNDEEEAEKYATAEAMHNTALLNKESVINFTQGVFGLETCRLPRTIWNIIKQYGTYHSGDEEDQEWADDLGYYDALPSTLKGWFYKPEAIQALIDEGYPVSYRGVRLSDIKELISIDKDLEAKEQQHFEAVAKYNKRKNELIKIRQELFNEGEVITKDVAQKLTCTEKLLYPAISVSGADVFGGGLWFHLDDEYLYIVKNNGADGDWWGDNNYPTGGAGAIAKRVKRNQKVNDYIKAIHEFESKSFNDYLLKM